MTAESHTSTTYRNIAAESATDTPQRVAVLPPELANQIAAGEVVERPASVVKELVENSLDAGARRIEVSIENGGRDLIRVEDDGSGMEREDALRALERHATSKIKSVEDLFQIGTLGFRGEAIPSIGSVSQFEIRTKPHGALGGTKIVVRGGEVQTVEDCGMAAGTVMQVEELFYNTPRAPEVPKDPGHRVTPHHRDARAHGPEPPRCTLSTAPRRQDQARLGRGRRPQRPRPRSDGPRGLRRPLPHL